MEYSSLEDAWGVKSFESSAPAFPDARPPMENWEPATSQYPVAGPWGYRPAHEYKPSLNPVAAVYLRDGVDGLLRLLPAHATEELKVQLGGSNLHTIATVVLAGFVLLLIWDILNRAKMSVR